MRKLLPLLLWLILVALAANAPGQSRPAYLVVMGSSSSIVAVDREFLADAFLKKTTQWPSGNVIHPVDLPPSSPVRRQFSDEVLHRSIAEVKSYWQQRIFSGRDVPPPELDSDDEVIRFVLDHDGAIGYVSGGAMLRGAKIVIVR